MTEKVKDMIVINGVEYRYTKLEEDKSEQGDSCCRWDELDRVGWMDLGLGNWKKRIKYPSDVSYG